MSLLPAPLLKVVDTTNPLKILMSLGDMAENMSELEDRVINTLDALIPEHTSPQLRDMVDRYRDAGVFRAVAHEDFKTGRFFHLKRRLGEYFLESSWCDLDFFIVAISKLSTYKGLIDALAAIARKVDLLETYRPLESVEARRAWLIKQSFLTEDAHPSLVDRMIEWFDAIAFTDLARSSIWSRVKGRNRLTDISITRILILSLLHAWERGEIATLRLFRSASTIEKWSEISSDSMLELYSWMRNRLVDGAGADMAGPPLEKDVLSCLTCPRRMHESDKIDYLLTLHEAVGFTVQVSERRLSQLRRERMFREYDDILIGMIDVPFLSRETFYTIRRRIADSSLTLDNPDLTSVQEAFKVFDSSWVLRALRPFFFARLSRVFSRRHPLYFAIKLLLTIHLSETYQEYKQLSRTFALLESREMPGMRWMLVRTAQIGWVYLAVGILFFIAPFGVMVGLGIYFVARRVQKMMEKRAPSWALNANFQLSAFALIIALISATLGSTMALSDNTYIVYRNFQSVIHAFSLVGSETVSLVSQNATLSADALGSFGASSSDTNLLDNWDYLSGETYSPKRSKE